MKWDVEAEERERHPKGLRGRWTHSEPKGRWLVWKGYGWWVGSRGAGGGNALVRETS